MNDGSGTGGLSWKLRDRELDFSSGPVLMGILNVTPDSFSDGGLYSTTEAALKRAGELLRDGVTVIDVGGESTRPGAAPVPLDEEIRRVEPVVREIKRCYPECLISIDTTKPAVAEAALDAGADAINDISGLQSSLELARLAANFGAGLILMHTRGTPATMRDPVHVTYSNVVEEVRGFLLTATERAVGMGIDPESLVVDPGIGFAKTTEQNLEILRQIETIRSIGRPVLVGTSRKSFIGEVLGSGPDPGQRIWGTAGTVAWLLAAKVEILRIHDSQAMAEMTLLFESCRNGGILEPKHSHIRQSLLRYR